MRLTTYCNGCRGEMGSCDVSDRHDPRDHPESTVDYNHPDEPCTSPTGELAIEMTGLLYCE